MGGVFRKLYGNKECRVIMQGLGAAGKTTILYKLKLGEIVTTIPTIGFNVETVEYKKIAFTAWDVGGRCKMRPLYRHYYPNTDALIYVVDSNDVERLDQACEELSSAMAEDELRDKPLLIYLNKQDLPGAISVTKVTEALKLNELRGRSWYVQPCCATAGDGLYEGLDWLCSVLKNQPHPGQAKTEQPSQEIYKASDFTWAKALEKFKSIFVA